MKQVAIFLAIAAAIAVIVLVGTSLRSAEEPGPVDAALRPMTYPRERVPLEIPSTEVEQALLKQMEAMAVRLEDLDSSVRELRRELALRDAAVTRTPVVERVVERSMALQSKDLDGISLRVRQELVNEAWRARQERYVSTGCWLVNEVPLRADTLDPLIETICRFERQWFDIERRQAETDHSVATARLVAEEQRRARARLHRELKKLYAESELVARLFLHVASHGEVRSLTLPKDDLFETEKSWLQ